MTQFLVFSGGVVFGVNVGILVLGLCRARAAQTT